MILYFNTHPIIHFLHYHTKHTHFSPEIDDQLPRLLGFDSAAIIENFLIQEAKLSYNEYLKLDKKDIIRMFDTGNDVETQSRIGKCKYGVDFSDFFITNSVMEGSNAHDFVQTFNVKVQESGPELDPSNYITERGMEVYQQPRYYSNHWVLATDQDE